jgi:hypothetical protein
MKPSADPPPQMNPFEQPETGQTPNTRKIYIKPELKDLGLLRTITKFSF